MFDRIEVCFKLFEFVLVFRSLVHVELKLVPYIFGRVAIIEKMRCSFWMYVAVASFIAAISSMSTLF